jgi:hypothetical protein
MARNQSERIDPRFGKFLPLSDRQVDYLRGWVEANAASYPVITVTPRNLGWNDLTQFERRFFYCLVPSKRKAFLDGTQSKRTIALHQTICSLGFKEIKWIT